MLYVVHHYVRPVPHGYALGSSQLADVAAQAAQDSPAELLTSVLMYSHSITLARATEVMPLAQLICHPSHSSTAASLVCFSAKSLSLFFNFLDKR